jgi:hypothetical protein
MRISPRPSQTHLLVATCETLCVVSRAVVETVDPD